MRVKNYNTSALMAALKSDLPTMRREATRLIKAAMREHKTQQKAAEALGTYDRSLRAMLTIIRERGGK
jgi:hypothetical protein